MINVRAIANTVTQTTNPNIMGVWKSSQGYTTNASGHREPKMTSNRIQMQVQGISAGDLQQMDALNIQGVMRSVHMYGLVQGAVRADRKGGDILQFPEFPHGPVRNWQVVHVMETWPTWARVIALLQV